MIENLNRGYLVCYSDFFPLFECLLIRFLRYSDLAVFTWNFPREAVDFLAKSAAFKSSAEAEMVGGPALPPPPDTTGVSPTPGRLTFRVFAMFRRRWCSFFATRSFLSWSAFSKGSIPALGPDSWNRHCQI